MSPHIKKWLPLTFVSLLLLAVLAFWFRSHLYADQFGWATESFGFFADVDSGLIMFTFSADANIVGRMRFLAGTGLVHFNKLPSEFAGTFMTWRNLGFGYEGDTGTGRQLTIPLYAISLLIGLLA